MISVHLLTPKNQIKLFEITKMGPLTPRFEKRSYNLKCHFYLFIYYLYTSICTFSYLLFSLTDTPLSLSLTDTPVESGDYYASAYAYFYTSIIQFDIDSISGTMAHITHYL